MRADGKGKGRTSQSAIHSYADTPATSCNNPSLSTDAQLQRYLPEHDHIARCRSWSTLVKLVNAGREHWSTPVNAPF